MALSRTITVITHSDRIEAQLGRYRDAIGADYEGYRRHIYRVLSYALHFLHGDETTRATIETALVYHDLGLWSDRAMAYLEPSVERAQADNASAKWGHDPALLRDIIYYHHKITPFVGAHADAVNAVRKADWIDASKGLIKMGMPKACIAEVTRQIPDAGFYDTLKRIGPELTGGAAGTFVGLMRVLKF